MVTLKRSYRKTVFRFKIRRVELCQYVSLSQIGEKKNDVSFWPKMKICRNFAKCQNFSREKTLNGSISGTKKDINPGPAQKLVSSNFPQKRFSPTVPPPETKVAQNLMGIKKNLYVGGLRELLKILKFFPFQISDT